MNISRIPDYKNHSSIGMKLWFSEMFENGLLFHPDDSPESIISIETGKEIFSYDEIIKIKEILSLMFNNFEDEVYEAAYPCFMKSLGIQGQHT
jgi:hypothetical protein